MGKSLNMEKRLQISVIGQGRFGKFWAEQISKAADVFVYDINFACAESSASFASPVNLDEALTKNYIVLTIPIREIKNFIAANADKISAGSILVDSASVKSVVIEWYEKFLPKNINYVFSHPLFGPDSGSKGLAGLSITLFPGKVNYGKYKVFVNLMERLGLNILTLSPEEHDYQMAYNLNLIHLLGRALDKMNIASIPLKMNALTYLNRMSHYVVNDSQILFEDFFAFNPFAGKIISDLQSELKNVIKNLPEVFGEKR